MSGEPDSAHRYAPDGLAGEALDELIDRTYAEVAKAPQPTSALVDGSAAEQRRHRMQHRTLAAVIRTLPVRRDTLRPDGREGTRAAAFGCRIPRSPGNADPATRAGPSASPELRPTAGGGINLTDAHDTRPGGPNRQERAHRVGAPKSPAQAIEEIGMVQVHTCMSVHCGQCGDSLCSAGFEAHYPTEDAALDAAAAEGWLVGPGGRLWCSACGPVLTCETEGHEFSGWRHPVSRDGQLVGSSEYRHCRRCCLHESRLAALLLAGVDVAAEVA